MVNWILQSVRLELRPCTRADVDLLLEHWREPKVRYYLFDNCMVDRESVEAYVAASSAAFQSYGYGLWVLISKTDGAFQGVCGLCETIVKPDLLFSIVPLYWGQRLATESGRCVLKYAFDKLRLPQVMATVDQPNTASIKVLQKLGMRLLEERLINQKPIQCYALGSGEYHTREMSGEVAS